MPEETVGTSDTAGCLCEPCKRKGGLPHNVRSGVIHSYTSQPRTGWVPRRVASDAPNAPTFGIELETDVPQRPSIADLPGCPHVPYLSYDATAADIAQRDAALREREAWVARNNAHRNRQRARWQAQGNITGDEAVSLAAPRGLWHAKHDGSVTGPEFASQPGSLAYWHAQRPHLANMFRGLLHGGMRSHDGDRCGLHINIGTDAFNGADGRPDAGHLERFAALVVANPRWSTRMAQRTHESVSHWARFDPLGTARSRTTWAAHIRDYGYASQDRYCVLNAQNSGRVEFRLPRGTLRIDRFYAKLEWTAAMVEYTRDAYNVPQVSAFVHWCESRPTEYPALLAFIRERFAGRLAATGGVA